MEKFMPLRYTGPVMSRLGFVFAFVVLACGVSPSACTPSSPLRDAGSDAATAADGPALGADMSTDPVVGRSCGPGAYCPCGYFCPAGKCEVADFHPPCDMH